MGGPKVRPQVQSSFKKMEEGPLSKTILKRQWRQTIRQSETREAKKIANVSQIKDARTVPGTSKKGLGGRRKRPKFTEKTGQTCRGYLRPFT